MEDIDDRIPTDVWVSAQLRGCAARGIPVYVLHRGAFAAGTVMVKVVMRGGGCRLYSQSRGLDGAMGWMDVFDGANADEKSADAYIARARHRDPDLWVVEAEEATGANPFGGKVF